MTDPYKAKLEDLYDKMAMPKQDFIKLLNGGSKDYPFKVENYYREMYGYTRSTVAMLLKVYKGVNNNGERDKAEDPTTLI